MLHWGLPPGGGLDERRMTRYWYKKSWHEAYLVDAARSAVQRPTKRRTVLRKRSSNMLRVTVSDLSISNVGPVILLKGESDDRTLPIFIMPPEAHAIIFRLNEVELPRPMTHDLLKNVLTALGAELKRIEIWDLEEGTFYGRLILSAHGKTLTIDSRPSDAINLALRCGAPILVAEKVMDEAGLILDA